MKKNGKAENPANNEVTTTLTVVKNETDSQTANTEGTEARERTFKSVKEIIEKNNRISKCVQQLEALDQAEKSLDSFNFGSSKIKDTLEINDGRGNSFETSNLVLVETVVVTLKEKIASRTQELENEMRMLEAA